MIIVLIAVSYTDLDEVGTVYYNVIPGLTLCSTMIVHMSTHKQVNVNVVCVCCVWGEFTKGPGSCFVLGGGGGVYQGTWCNVIN